jgi:transcription elongation factor Elf1
MADKLPSKEIQDLIRKVVDHFDKEDSAIRERQVQTWRRLKLMWEGFHKTWYDEVAHDWRIYNEEAEEDSHYDKPINVFRAYLESIIAALSVVVPPVKCFPDNAEDTLDLQTAKAGDKIGQLIYRHNNVSLVWLHNLYIYCTEGLVACHTYKESDKKYGTYEQKIYKKETEISKDLMCPSCGHILAVDFDGELIEPEVCENCGNEVTPVVENKENEIDVLDRIDKLPKTRIKIDSYGGLNVKVPNWARKQSECPYLTLAVETHYVNAIEKYAHLHAGKDKLTQQKIQESTGPTDTYEELSRISPQYQGDYPEHVVTLKSTWFRPCAFNVLTEEETKKLKKAYPDGMKVVYVNDSLAEVDEKGRLDDEWTLSHNPLADFIHHDPIGLLLVSVQEITNNLISLILQTIEHGIPQTFADPGVLDFDAYRNTPVVVGGIYEAKPKSGKSVSDAFYGVNTATLSPEILPFFNQIQSLGQLVSGASPTIFGGNLEGSETASEYSMSRAQALQRLQTTWKVFNILWKDMFGKAIPMFIEEVKEDERDVLSDKDGNFVNVLIKKSELEGKIGRVELEAADGIPLTWQQRKDVVMQLLTASSPEVLAIINAPENLTAIRDAIGLTNFVVPGEDDTIKQHDEIRELLNSEPISTGEQEGMINPDGSEAVPFIPSIEPDLDFDNHKIHFEICKNWIISDAGRQAKVDNEAGYENVLLHAKAHLLLMQQAIMQSMSAETQALNGAAPNAKPDVTKTKEAPITETNDVQVTV